MSTAIPNRISKGVSEGGQFARHARAEPEVSLASQRHDLDADRLARDLALMEQSAYEIRGQVARHTLAAYVQSLPQEAYRVRTYPSLSGRTAVGAALDAGGQVVDVAEFERELPVHIAALSDWRDGPSTLSVEKIRSWSQAQEDLGAGFEATASSARAEVLRAQVAGRVRAVHPEAAYLRVAAYQPDFADPPQFVVGDVLNDRHQVVTSREMSDYEAVDESLGQLFFGRDMDGQEFETFTIELD